MLFVLINLSHICSSHHGDGFLDFIKLFSRSGSAQSTGIRINPFPIFICIALLITIGIYPRSVIGQEANRIQTETRTEKTAFGPLSALEFYVVIDGKMESRVIKGRDLSSKSFQTDGYVSGIVAVGSPGIDARVDGRNMSTVPPKEDGTISLGYYGKIKPSQLIDSDTESIAAGEKNRRPNEVYSYFPLVPADTVNPKKQFEVEFRSGADLLRMQVNHCGARMLKPAACLGPAGGLQVQYIGGGNIPSECEAEERVRAVSKGVAAVESVFHMDLVSQVNIIGFEEIHNAITCAGDNEIWVYASTFRDEPVKELNVIAEHEALHILVDRLELTQNRTIRNMFADLKGFDTLSIDRFRLTTSGRISREARSEKGTEGYFFDFISERNFLNGMKGGHPQEDLDEFCASFLHTLMYMDRFEANLAKPISGGPETEAPDLSKKTIILQKYITLLGVVRDAMNRKPSISTGGIASAEGITPERLELVKAINRQLQADNSSRQTPD